MHILCTICSDLVHHTENIHVTKCGHIFHHDCLNEWILRSKTCPQCRNKVTDRCMFRLYPTISNDPTGVDATTLQSRLDDALFKLREKDTKHKEQLDKLAESEASLKTSLQSLAKLQKKLESKESAISALTEQLAYLKVQNQETNKLREENEILNKKIQTLTGLQNVLNATCEDVEQMLQGYTDIRTVATFASALKRALCDTEKKKNESRDKLQVVKQQLAAETDRVNELHHKLLIAEEKLAAFKQKYKDMKLKRKSPEAANRSLTNNLKEPPEKQMRPNEDLSSISILNDTNTSLNTLVNRIENADSPYLNLKQSNLALTTLQRHPTHPLPERNLKPSEYALLSSARNATSKQTLPSTSKTSIFHKKEPPKIQFSQENDPDLSLANISYDGLGGHSKLDTFPVPNKRQPQLQSFVPKLSAKHKLKRPNPVGNQDISIMLQKKNKTSN